MASAAQGAASGDATNQKKAGILPPQQINFTPRQYQLELLEAGLRRNTIVCLQTGSGKTFIAVMFIKELSHEIRKSFKNGGKITVFLVNTVPLVSQQANVIRIHTNLTVGEYIGAMGVDLWSKDRWLVEFEKNQVLVMTCQIFVDIMNHGFIGLSRVKALIFDECHHAVKNHPYREVMRFFDICPADKYPRVMGLSASVLNSKCSPVQLERKLCDLELTLRSTIETATNAQSVSRFGTKPVESVVYCSDNIHLLPYTHDVHETLDETLQFLQKSSHYLKSCSKVPEDADELLRYVRFEDEKDPTLVPRQAVREAMSALEDIGPLGLKLAVPLILRELQKHERSQLITFNKKLLIYTSTQLRLAKKKKVPTATLR